MILMKGGVGKVDVDDVNELYLKIQLIKIIYPINYHNVLIISV